MGPIGMILRVFPSVDIVLDTAPKAPAGFTAIFFDGESTLRLGHHTNTSLFALICVLALATAIAVAFIGLGINTRSFIFILPLAVHY